MFLFVICFLLGDVYLQTFKSLPNLTIFYSLILINCLVFIASRKYARCLCYLFAFMLGFIWSGWYASSLLAWNLPEEKEGKTIILTGFIASLPNIEHKQVTYLFAVDKILIRLSWRNAPKRIRVGDKWQVAVRVKRIHGMQNPGSFDYEAWALQKGIRGTGRVVISHDNRLLSHAWYRYPVDHIRQKLQDKILLYSPHSKTSPWLMALIIGERAGITQADWQVLRNTGTNHLMAIAGLHIGIIAGFTHILITWVWRRVPKLVLIFPAHLAGACAALIIAVLYSALAGFSIPTQRACIMFLIFILALLARRKINSWDAWALAMFLVLLLNPLSLLTESFWLSFGTIALIIFGMSGRLAPKGLWWKWGRVQWVIGLGLIPFTLNFFQQCSIISFVANSIAIPWLGFFVLPFCFLSSIFLFVSPAFANWLLFLADKSLSVLWVVLTFFSQFHFATWQQAMPTLGILILTLFGFLLLLLPAGVPGKWLGVVWLLPIFLFKPVTPKFGDYWLTLLDVGQGLAVVVQTHAHTLVFDTGPKLSPAFDMGESVVLPYLHIIGAKKIDMLVISHGDNDHIGGAQALLQALPVLAIKTSVPEMLPSPLTDFCINNYSWEWDNVHFRFLHPGKNEINLGNNSSCVLSIDNGYKRVLLTGDIEKYAEKKLIENSAKQLSADVLIAPHHGSKTSAIKGFVSSVHPKFVLYAIGYRNRYHFPHPSVIERYAKVHSMQLNTADAGAITFKFDRGQVNSMPERYRILHKRYWLD